ncbi:unnamed protein product, partial [Polarella glacialis]
VYKLGKEPLLVSLAERLKTRVLVPPVRAAALAASGLRPELFAQEPCSPELAPVDELWRLSLRGCVWVVPRQKLRKCLWHASACGAAAHGIIPTGWACRHEDLSVTGSTEDAGVDEGIQVSDDGVSQFPYSDHCSFLELVQFLSWLPAAPVTFITPLPASKTGFGYDGEEGLKSLMEQSGAPSICYSPPLSRAPGRSAGARQQATVQGVGSQPIPRASSNAGPLGQS